MRYGCYDEDSVFVKGKVMKQSKPYNYKKQALRVYAYYAAVFFFFCTCYACLTYTTAYYLDSGLSNTSIGVIQSVNSVFAFLVPPVMGILADKMRSTRKALVICVLLNIAGFIVTPNLRGFVPLLALSSAFAGTRNASDSLTMTWVATELDNARTQQGIHLNYGSVRVWGSVGYSLFCILLNILMDQAGLTIQGSFYIGAAGMLGMLTLLLMGNGKKPAPGSTAAAAKPLTLRQLKPGRLFRNYYYMTYLVAYILIWLASCFGLNYTTNLLKEIGVSSAFLGTVSGIRAIFEMPGIFFSAKLAKKFGYEKCILASGVVFCLESFLFLTAHNSMMVLAAQALHGLFDGLFMGLYVSYLFTLVPRSLAATTQTLNMALANVVSMVFYLLGGAIVDNMGVRTVYYLAAVIPAVGVVWFAVTLAIGKAKKIPRYDPALDETEQALTAAN